ncbi:MAG: hypothetical protein QUS66_06145, partial [Bacteroidota bacterium]|nr:hypothetical protein [Bacteroidota bacterium]
MRKLTAILLLSLAVAAGCSTTKKTDGTSVPDAAAADRAAASETLAAVPCRCDSLDNGSPWVKFLRVPEQVTYQPQFDILCKSEYPATVTINGQEVKQYKTGIFFATVSFTEGVNKVTAEAVYPDGRKAVCEYAFIYEKRDMTRQPFPLWVERRSVEPAPEVELLPDEVVRVSFTGSKGQEGWVDVRPGRLSIKCTREDFSDYSIYRAEVPLRGFAAGVTHTMYIRLVTAAGAPVKETLRPDFARKITVRNP